MIKICMDRIRRVVHSSHDWIDEYGDKVHCYGYWK